MDHRAPLVPYSKYGSFYSTWTLCHYSCTSLTTLDILNNVGGDFTWILPTRSWSNHSLYNISNCAITFSIVLTSNKAYYPEALYQFITIALGETALLAIAHRAITLLKLSTRHGPHGRYKYPFIWRRRRP